MFNTIMITQVREAAQDEHLRQHISTDSPADRASFNRVLQDGAVFDPQTGGYDFSCDVAAMPAAPF